MILLDTSAPRSDPHREKFVRSFRRLLLDAGFLKDEVTPQGPTEMGPDIIVTHKVNQARTVKILIQCRSTAEVGKEYKDLNNLIRIYDSYVRHNHADVALLALEGYKVPDAYKDRSTIESVRRRHKVCYWDYPVIQYYRKTVKTLGHPYSRYVILRDLDFQEELQTNPYMVDAFQVAQHPRGERIWVFTIEPEKLLSLAYVFRRGSRDPAAYQRMLKGERLRKIGRFLSQDDSLLPNNLVVAFDEKVKFKNGKLSIPARTCSVWIIDGQHRLYGFCKLNKDLGIKEKRNIRRNYKLVATGIRAYPRTQARLFQEINQYQEKINRNLLLDLYDYLQIDPGEHLLQRIQIAKNLRDTPQFESKIKILPTEKGNMTLASIVDYFRFKELVSRYGDKSRPILKNYFKAVSEVFHDEWEHPEAYVFATNKGVRMLLSLLSYMLDYFRRTKQDHGYQQMKKRLETLKEACRSETDYFKIGSYTGKALGAGSPDLVTLELWAARIDDQVENFLSRPDKSRLMGSAQEVLEELEAKFRKCIQSQLEKVSGDWWKERIPDDVRQKAEENKRKNDKPWPWLEGEDLHPVQYVDFSGYQKILLRRDNWENVFQPIFGDQDITAGKLKELEPIRNNIAHNRKLSSSARDRLKMYATDLVSCINACLQ